MVKPRHPAEVGGGGVSMKYNAGPNTESCACAQPFQLVKDGILFREKYSNSCKIRIFNSLQLCSVNFTSDGNKKVLVKFRAHEHALGSALWASLSIHCGELYSVHSALVSAKVFCLCISKSFLC